jgi:hypothetical protein
MSDLTATVSLSGVTDFRYDNSSGLLDLVTSAGGFYRWDVHSGAFLSGATLGGQLSSLDFTPDGQYALVGHSNLNGGVAEIDRIRLSDLSVQQLSFPNSGFSELGVAHIAVLGNDVALATTDFAGSGWTPFRQFDAEAPTISAAAVSGLNSVRQSSYLIPSEHAQYVLIMENNISNGPLEIYDSSQNKIVSRTDLYTIDSSGYNSGQGDINENAGLVVDLLYNNLYIFDIRLNLVKDMSNLNSHNFAGAHFSADGRHLFLWNQVADQIQSYNTSTWQFEWAVSAQHPTFPLVAGIAGAAPTGLMRTSADGHFLFLNTGTGFEALDISGHTPPRIADLNGDGASDLAFRNGSTGQWGFMSANPAGGQTWHTIGSASLGYDAVGMADFNGDGISDIAFRSSATGDFGYMSPTGTGGQTWRPVGPTSTDYQATGAGDFNGDGVHDVAFRNGQSGDFGFMTVNPAGGEAWHGLGPTSTSYAPVGAGDFNGDGSTDVAFRNLATGDFGFMSANPGGGEVWHGLGPTTTSYTVVGVGDFNGDGRGDVAFCDLSTGDWGFMSANPGGGETWHGAGPSSTAYAAVKVGDFNGDGLADLAFRNIATGDWGYMTAISSGGELWHGVGSSSVDYLVL